MRGSTRAIPPARARKGGPRRAILMNVSAEAELSQIVGESSIRSAGTADLVDGAAPDHVIEPATPEAAAAVLAWCSTHRQSVVVRGGGSRMGWGRLPTPI